MNVDRVAIIKQIVNPIDLARRYLGQPIHESGYRVWYKSPFRAEERTASFLATERGFYDFGTGQYYDVISFVMNKFNCDFKTACEILEKDYGIEQNPYVNNEVVRVLKKQAEDNKRYAQEVKMFITNFSCELARVYRKSIEMIELEKREMNFFNSDRYAELLDVNVKLEGLLEYVDEVDKFEDEEKIYQRRGELENVFGRYKKIVLQV